MSDAEWLEHQRHLLDCVCRVFGVSAEDIARIDDSPYGRAEREARAGMERFREMIQKRYSRATDQKRWVDNR